MSHLRVTVYPQGQQKMALLPQGAHSGETALTVIGQLWYAISTAPASSKSNQRLRQDMDVQKHNDYADHQLEQDHDKGCEYNDASVEAR